MAPMDNRLLRPRASGGFTPRLLANLGGWWDATDSSSYTLDTGVTQWRDKSGLGQVLTQSVGANQPTINSTGIGGKPALSFNGLTNFMTLGSATIGGNNLFAEAANSYSIYIVHRFATSGTLLAQAVSDAAQRVLQVLVTSNSLTAVVRGGSVSGGVGNPANVDGLYAATWTGSVFTNRFNNTTATVSVGASSYATDDILVGARTSSAPFLHMNGRIGEIIFYNRVLSASEQSRLFTHLNTKWGLSLT
jgi:hypothetical protein